MREEGVGGEMLCQAGGIAPAEALPGFHSVSPGREPCSSSGLLPCHTEGGREKKAEGSLDTAPNCPAHICSRQTMRKRPFAPTITAPLI